MEIRRNAIMISNNDRKSLFSGANRIFSKNPWSIPRAGDEGFGTFHGNSIKEIIFEAHVSV
jgi:hypothetical protein